MGTSVRSDICILFSNLCWAMDFITSELSSSVFFFALNENFISIKPQSSVFLRTDLVDKDRLRRF